MIKKENSVGLVVEQVYQENKPFILKSGDKLPGFKLVYETYGKLNTERSNAVLICHALSGHHHAAGVHSEDDKKPGWWDSCIGPNKPIDTNKFFVVSLNNLGGCHGSTGPIDINPETGETYGSKFPAVSVDDWVSSQVMLTDHLGIKKYVAVIGGSLGGMQAMQWAIDYPNRLSNAIVIAAAPKLSAQNIAFNEIARHAIESDPEFHNGNYIASKTKPTQGLMIARMIGHVTYLSDDGMGAKFGRELQDHIEGEESEFQIQSYLHHQGEVFSQNFDANTYVLMTKALDYFDPSEKFDNDLTKTLAPALCNFLVISFTSDWRFPVDRSREIVKALVAANKNVSAAEIESTHGHDSFLLPIARYFNTLSAFMNRTFQELNES
jgi:homoserine O-acetyltransferase